MNKTWTADALLELGRSYQPAAILAAAADLEIFDALDGRTLSLNELARRLHCSARGLKILLDASVALGLLEKGPDGYALPHGSAPFLTSTGARSIMAMAQHQANCLRHWVQLAKVVKTGRPADHAPSIRGADKDAAAFIGAMHNVSAPNADRVVSTMRSLPFQHLLDVGGASGTWTMAFLRRQPSARATLFDLPHVLPMARRRLRTEGMNQRVRLVAGDFTVDRLPTGVDLAWVSAIVHQNSREQNRDLFGKVFQALIPGGAIAIRDIVMDESRTRPIAGALFAINMLVATNGGGTFTLNELRQDLQSAGFTKVSQRHRDQGMNSIVVARKPVKAHGAN